MDLNLIRSLVPVAAFVGFLVIVVNAWRASNAARFAEAAALPLADDLPQPTRSDLS